MRSLIALTCLLLTTASAHADEVWETPFGDVTYLADEGDVAIFENSDFEDDTRLYFPGLAGNFQDRGVHQGYWIQAGGEACGATMTGPDGLSGGIWGRLTLVFHDSGFPSDWTLLRGMCFGEPVEPMRGTARVAE